MDTLTTTAPATDRSKGRACFWWGITLCLLGIALAVVQYSLKFLIVPWYAAVLATLGAFLLAAAAAKRPGIVRIVVLVLILALAGFEWYFLVSLSKLPRYEGPAQAGQQFPAFRTSRADGSPFTEKDLQDGQASVLVFFRGRW